MKREYRQRAATLEDIAREYVKDEPLEVQLAVANFVAKAKQEAAKQHVGAAEGVIDGVVDFERGWILK